MKMLVVLNHKMNLSIDEIRVYEKKLRKYEVVVMPQTPYMGLFTSGEYILGSQCISEYNAPGGISAESLTSMKVKYVLVGHAERRIVRKETDYIIAQKIRDIINNNMIPIMCVGETLAEKEAGKSLEVIQNQICHVFDQLEGNLVSVIIAYEPVWCIGSAIPPTNEEITGMIEYIKIICSEKYGLKPKMLYGGAVNAESIKTIKDVKNLAGVLVGGASLDIDEVISIYNVVNGSK